MLEDQLCYTCRWGWEFDPDESPETNKELTGTCHRHAPTCQIVTANEVSGLFAEWPTVCGFDGCGDWTKRRRFS